MTSAATLPAVLLAEDDPDDLYFFKRTLEKAQIENPLVVFNDGEEAVAYLTGCIETKAFAQPGAPCMLFLDNKMPLMSGMDVLNWVRARPELQTLKIVMISTSAEPPEMAKAKELGADGYLVKYPTPEAIAAIVREAEAELQAKH